LYNFCIGTFQFLSSYLAGFFFISDGVLGDFDGNADEDANANANTNTNANPIK